MQLRANGKPADALRELGINASRTVVELNGKTLSRAVFPTANLSGGDSFEPVHFVGGG